jgi:Sec-independent protein translocase protein TatA
MFDISWGELFVVTGLGFVLIGKKDLPKAAGFVGNRIGRIVGLLQGARARADNFAQETELKQLHNELRAGLRELDAVKSEMAVAMSSRSQGIGMMNRTTLQSSSSSPPPPPPPRAAQEQANAMGNFPPPGQTTAPPVQPTLSTGGVGGGAENIPAGPSIRALPPASQTIAAVVEEEWEKQGIGFRSMAERGVGLGYRDEDANDPLKSGSSILANIIQQNLIFDQYDRVVQEQDNILQSKIEDIQAKRSQEKKNKERDLNVSDPGPDLRKD